MPKRKRGRQKGGRPVDRTGNNVETHRPQGDLGTLGDRFNGALSGLKEQLSPSVDGDVTVSVKPLQSVAPDVVKKGAQRSVTQPPVVGRPVVVTSIHRRQQPFETLASARARIAELEDEIKSLLVSSGIEKHRNTQEIKRLQETVRGLNASIETHDSELGALDRDRRREQEQARELGSQANTLRTHLNALQLEKKKWLEEAEGLRSKVADLESDMTDLQGQLTASGEHGESARFRTLFLDLVHIEIPRWASRRDVFFRIAEAEMGKLRGLEKEVRNLLVFLQDEIFEAEQLDTTKAFESSEARWSLFLAKSKEVKVLFEEYKSKRSELIVATETRESLIERSGKLKGVASKLQRRVLRLVSVYKELGLDLWEETDANANVLEHLKIGEIEAELLVAKISIPDISRVWKKRYDVVTRNLHPPAPKRKAGRRSSSASRSADVKFFPGSVFVVEPEKELERLCLILLQIWKEERVPSIADQADLSRILVQSKLCQNDKDLPARIKDVLEKCNLRGLIRRTKYNNLDRGGTSIGYITSNKTNSAVEDLFLQVQGRQAEALKKLLKNALETIVIGYL